MASAGNSGPTGGFPINDYTEFPHFVYPNVGNPGLAKNVICVGSIAYVNNPDENEKIGDVSRFSSRGPTKADNADSPYDGRYRVGGRLKPELVAPGGSSLEYLDANNCNVDCYYGGVVSPFSPYSSSWCEYSTTTPYYYKKGAGTSLAVPHVTGVIAKMIDWDHNLRPEKIKAILINSALPIRSNSNSTPDDTLRAFSNIEAGYGMVNAYSCFFHEGDTDGDFKRLLLQGKTISYPDNHTYTIGPGDIPAGTRKLMVTLAYDDRAGLGSDEIFPGDLIDNLDLTITGPNETFRTKLQAGCTQESPIEKICIADPDVNGTYTVNVKFLDIDATEIRYQYYALVVDAIIGEPELDVVFNGSQNILIEPGAQFDLEFSVENPGGWVAAGVTVKIEGEDIIGLPDPGEPPVYIGNINNRTESIPVVLNNLLCMNMAGTDEIKITVDCINLGAEPVEETFTVNINAPLTIKGIVKSELNQEGIPGVILNGLPTQEDVITDSQGCYTATVPMDWTGVVTPHKTYYIFSPEYREYSDPIHDNLDNEDYLLPMYKVSGKIINESGEGISGIEVLPLVFPPESEKEGISGISQEPDGCFEVWVEHWWGGRMQPVNYGQYNEYSTNGSYHVCINSDCNIAACVASHRPLIYVDSSNDLGPWLGNYYCPYGTISDAIADACPGDTIVISEGEYSGSNIQLSDDLTIRSKNGDPTEVIITTGWHIDDPLFIGWALSGRVRLSGITLSCGWTAPFGDGKKLVEITGCAGSFNLEFDNCVLNHFKPCEDSDIGSAVNLDGSGCLQLTGCRFYFDTNPHSHKSPAIYIDGTNDNSIAIDDCEFDNTSRAIYIVHADTLQINNCKFTGGEAGYKEYIHVDVSNALNEGLIELSDCEVSDVTGSDLILLRAGNAGQIAIDKCLFHDNEMDELLDLRSHIGINITNCTFTGNGGFLGSGSGREIIRCNDQIYAWKCIIAGNVAKVFSGPFDDPDITLEYSCIYRNYKTYNLSGTTNIVVDPEFCDVDNGDYSISAISPCINAGPAGGYIGGIGPGCVPQCAMVAEYADPNRGACGPFFNVCPAGDWETVVISLDFEDNLTRDIVASEITVLNEPVSGETFEFFSENPIIASGDATEAGTNKYTTTIQHDHFGGAGSDYVQVLLNGYPLGQCEVYLKSADLANCSLREVNTSDLSYFGEAMGNDYGDEGYNDLCDFNGDSLVNNPDLSYFGQHYHDRYEGTPPLLAESEQETGACLEITIDESRKFSDNEVQANFFIDSRFKAIVAGFFLEVQDDDARLVKFNQNTEMPFRSFIAEIQKETGPVLFVSMFGDKESIPMDKVKIGTAILKIKDPLRACDREGYFRLVFGEIMDNEGNVYQISGLKQQVYNSPKVLSTRLIGNYPNPFNPTTQIKYSVGENGNISLSIYSVSGKLVQTLVNKKQNKGEYTVIWNGKDNRGAEVASGVYFYRLMTKNYTEARKLVILR